jgi:hypothetical protein
MLKAFPFTIFPLILFNVVAFIVPGMDTGVGWEAGKFDIGLFSGASWIVTSGDLVVVFGLVCLFFEMLRATIASRGALNNHLASVVVLIIYAVEFLVVARCGNSTFFLLTVISLVDVLAGFAVSFRVASRDLTIGGAGQGG